MRDLLLAIASAPLLSACGSPTATAPAAGAAGAADILNARSYNIYIANIGNNTITTYEADGTQTTPTIHTGNGTGDYLFGAAVGPSGKIYALNFDPLLGPGTSGTVTTYKPDGTQTTPTITIRERGYFAPMGLAVDKNRQNLRRKQRPQWLAGRGRDVQAGRKANDPNLCLRPRLEQRDGRQQRQDLRHKRRRTTGEEFRNHLPAGRNADHTNYYP